MTSVTSRPLPMPTLIDEMLIDIAIRVQLSPTMHAIAVERYEAIARWLEREGSALRGQVRLVYAQGSMAIGSTIRSKEDDDLFDIDLIVEVDWAVGTTPAQMLSALFHAIRGEKGSRYYDMVELQTRCVTVHYADMHLDITPMRRNHAWAARGGFIAHAKLTAPVAQHKLVAANPWGFAQDFKAKTPSEDWFSRVFLEKSYGRVIRADAEPIPEHEVLYAKPMAVVALQMIKRHIYLIYERKRGTQRRPPSVYVSESFARNAGHTSCLIDELIFQATHLRAPLVAASQMGELIDVRNPALIEDRLTDRWPGNLVAQRVFQGELSTFIEALVAAKAERDAGRLRERLAFLFGENAATEALTRYYERAGLETKSGTSRFHPRTSTALAGLSGAQAPAANVATVRPHRFYGD